MQKWDVAQLFALFYVSFTVPLRLGFGLEVPEFTFEWFLELAVDIYFWADLVLQFFTAYWLGEGVLEFRKSAIAMNYIKGWFLIDVVSGEKQIRGSGSSLEPSGPLPTSIVCTAIPCIWSALSPCLPS